MPSRRGVLGGALSAAIGIPTGLLAKPRPAKAYYMTPATGVADFANPGTRTLTWAFLPEILHRDLGGGARHVHFELQTKAYTDPNSGITYGPGTFVRGTASGLFTIDLGADLIPNAPQFWWPGGVNGGATQTQPPSKAGQNLTGWCSNTEGIDAAALSNGYTSVIPVPAQDASGLFIFLQLTGIGKQNKNVTAADFIASGQINIHGDVFYMVGE